MHMHAPEFVAAHKSSNQMTMSNSIYLTSHSLSNLFSFAYIHITHAPIQSCSVAYFHWHKEANLIGKRESCAFFSYPSVLTLSLCCTMKEKGE